MSGKPSQTVNSGIYDVLARARNDVWFAGTYTTHHYDGTTIEEEPPRPP